MEITDLEIEELLLETSFPFLAASEGKWIGSDGKTLLYRQMSLEYLENALRYLQKYENGLEHTLGANLKELIKKKPVAKRKKYLADFDEILEYCIDLYEDKKIELEKILS